MKYTIGSPIKDCFLGGRGTLDNICNPGVIESAGKDWIIIRDLGLDAPIFIAISLEQFNIEENE